MSFQRIAHWCSMGTAVLALCAGLSAQAADAPAAPAPDAPQASAPAAEPAVAPAAAPATAPAVAPSPAAIDAAAPQAEAPAAPVFTGPTIDIDFSPVPGRTSYALFKNALTMNMRAEITGDDEAAPKGAQQEANVSMSIDLGMRQAVSPRAKDGSVNVVSTTERFSMNVEPAEIAKMMEKDLAEMNDLIGMRAISRVDADGSQELLRVEPPKGKKGKAQDIDQKWAEMDQWVSQIPHGKHSLHVGESLTVKLNYPMQGGVMPASVDMELIFTLSKIEGSIATFDLTPKLKFEADHPLLKGLEATGDGVLVFDAKQRLTKNMRVSLKLESHAEVRPGMIAHALITSTATGVESLKPFPLPPKKKAQPAAKKKG